MDESQILLSSLLQTVPGCIGDRQKLKATLMDILPSKKREVNLLLCAYDEGVIEKLRNFTDPTLHALCMVKTLSDEYGLTKDAAIWSIMTWCHILGKVEIACSLEELPFDKGKTNNATHVLGKTRIIGIGTYKAGFDFKPGDINLAHLTKDLHSPGFIDEVKVLHGGTIECYINTSSSIKGAKKICSFSESCHLEIEDGQYLILKTSNNFADNDLIKIELTEFD